MTKSKFSFSTKDILSYRNEMYGIATVLILIFHIARTSWFPFFKTQDDIFYSFLNNYIINFRIGVDLFIFLSPIGLYRSMQKNNIKTFYINRIKRVLIPCLIMFIPYYIWRDFFYLSDSFFISMNPSLFEFSPFLHRLLMFLGDITTVNYWIPGMSYSFCYISFIIIIYAVYPLIFYLDKKTKHISTAVLFVFSIIYTIHINIAITPYTDQIETLLSRLPVFFLGVLLSQYINGDHKIPIWVIPIASAMWGVAFWQLLVWCSDKCFRLLGSAFAVLSVLLFAFLMKCGKKVMYYLNTPFRFIGGYSLEVYILHLILYNVINALDKNVYPLWSLLPGSLDMLIILILSLSLGMLVRLLTKLITTKKAKETQSAAYN